MALSTVVLLAVCAVSCGAMLLAEHVALWAFNKHIPPTAAYTLGTATIGLWLTAWCVIIGFAMAAVAFWVIAGVGGATVITCYWVRAVASDSDGLAFWAGSVYQEAERTYGQANNGAERATGEY